MEQFFLIVEIASCILTLAALLALFVKPIRKKLFNVEREHEGEKCLLRSEMLRTYYNNVDSETIRQYELENFIKLYEAYKALNGNSFIDEVSEQVRTWKIIS